MNVISLSFFDLSLAALLVIALALLTIKTGTGQSKTLLIAASRSIVQLLLIGLLLNTIFQYEWLSWVILLMLVMAAIAGYEVTARQNRRFSGIHGYALGTVSMFVSTFSVLIFTLLFIIQPEPWFKPQYAIPLFGMLLGNSMTGIALALDRLTDAAYHRRGQIEAQLMLGVDWKIAIADVRTDALRSGLMPIINSMAAAGVVSLPGMMTGQILGGTPPVMAAKYQILILFMISVASGIGTIIAIHLGSRRLFDTRQRLVLSRLTPSKLKRS